MLAAAPSFAQTAEPPPSLNRQGLEELARRSAHDVKVLSTAPLHWRSRQWEHFGEGIALIAVAYAGDTKIVNAIQRNHHASTDRYLLDVTKLGGGLGEELTIATAAAGYLFHDDRLADTGIDALESSIWAAGVVTPAIKRVAGRARPIQEQGPHSYHPFDSHDQSFPSGHATNAFAIATAIATRYDDHPSVAIVAYTLATSVAVARVNERAHFPSDVVAGALIGHAIAKSIVHEHLSIVPLRHGIAAHLTF